MKAQFIQSLKNGQTPVLENKKQLEQLVQENVFEPFNSNLVEMELHSHRWSAEYFFTKITDLDFNFSKELATHLVEVKKFLQEKASDARFQLKPIENQVESLVSVTESKAEEVQSARRKQQAVSYSEKFAKIDLGNFKPNERLLNFLAEGNVNKIRTDLMSILNNRRLDLEEVSKSIWYVWQNNPEIFVDEEESVFVQGIDNNEANWNSEYFNLQQVYLNRNFSLERLLHLVNVRETLMKRGDKNFQQIKVEKMAQHNTATTQPEGHKTIQSSKQENRQPSEPSYQSQTRTDSDHKGINKLLLVGGAVLALFAALFAIFK